MKNIFGTLSVTRKKSPNVYKSCPKMISLEKLKILTPLQKLPKNVGDLSKIIVAQGFKSRPKCKNCQVWSHWAQCLNVCGMYVSLKFSFFIYVATYHLGQYYNSKLLTMLKRPVTSVTRLGDILDFGQLFKAFGNNLFAQISHILRQFL